MSDCATFDTGAGYPFLTHTVFLKECNFQSRAVNTTFTRQSSTSKPRHLVEIDMPKIHHTYNAHIGLSPYRSRVKIMEVKTDLEEEGTREQ